MCGEATPLHPAQPEHNPAASQHTLHAHDGQGGGQRQNQRHASHAQGLLVPGSALILRLCGLEDCVPLSATSCQKWRENGLKSWIQALV